MTALKVHGRNNKKVDYKSMCMLASWIVFVPRRIWLGRLASAYITVWLIYRQMSALRGSAEKREEVKIQPLALSVQGFFFQGGESLSCRSFSPGYLQLAR